MGFGALVHNFSVIQQAERTINACIRSDMTIWFEDEDGNRMFPKGEIHIGYMQPVLIKRVGGSDG